MKFLNLSKSSGAIPRLPVWEFVILFYLLIYTTTSLITGVNVTRITELLGETWGPLIWYGGLTVATLLYLIGMALPAPNGLVITLAGTMIIFLLAFSVAVGLTIISGTFFFMGNGGLWIFSMGGLLRSIQTFNMLTRLERSLAKM